MNTTNCDSTHIEENTGGESELSSTQNLNGYGEQLSDSKKRWQQPRNVKELVAQINEIATMVLNDEISLEKATKYSSLARGVGQLMNIELYRARMQKQMPDMDF